MAYCENCGLALSEAAKFCNSCGKRIEAPASPLAAAPAKKSSSLLNYLLGVAATLVSLACLGVGTAYYFLHGARAKAADAIQNLPDANSILNSLPSSGSQPRATPPATESSTTRLDPNRIVTFADGQCALFTKEELTQVLGTTFSHADADATGCTYKGDAPREWVRTEALWKGGRKLIQDKKTAYNQLSHSMPKGNIPIQPYPGVGDEAWVNLWNVVTAREGDAGITIDLRYYHDSDDLTKMLSNAALARLKDKNPASFPKLDHPAR